MSDSISTTASSSASASSTDTADTTVDTSDTDPTEGMECGNGVREGDEECDKGEENRDDGPCLSTCRANVCGDGHIGPGQPCDDDNDIDDDACSNDCVPLTCGNRILDIELGEECDWSAPDNMVECTPACQVNVCGDGHKLGNETCDDGNPINEDACLDTCLPASCGDQFVQFNVEECDDDNDDTDECAQCLFADCGDGFVQDGVEDCDGLDPAQLSCADFGFDLGEPSCTGDCQIDTEGCTNCGNSSIDDGEQCDSEGDPTACNEVEGWVGNGEIACEACQLQVSECCQIAGEPCAGDGEDTCCNGCDQKTMLCIEG